VGVLAPVEPQAKHCAVLQAASKLMSSHSLLQQHPELAEDLARA
jgi:hemin uptake protein HemP